jgi:hypothetical protein
MSRFEPLPAITSVAFLTATLLTTPLLAQPTPRGGPRSVVVDLFPTTQGGFWPPSEMADENGDFVLVGRAVVEIAPGVFIPQRVNSIVSKDTVPLLDEDGVLNPFNWFAAAYDIVRPLDLTPGSPDLEMVLYAQSWGPAVGNQGPTPRIPAEGDSLHNLNTLFTTCPELFPVSEQAATYRRPRMPLHEVPIWGFQGDQIAYDPVTGEPFDPATATGAGCPFEGCSGEDVLNRRRTDPITLGEWLRARGRVRVTLEDFDPEAGGFTAASFHLQLRHLIPDAVYTVWAIRGQVRPNAGVQRQRQVAPLAIPNVVVTDSRGHAAPSFKVVHPFPDPATDVPQARRIFTIAIVYHSDYQNWGACFGRFGAGVEVHAHMNTAVEGRLDITDFVTVPPSRSP